jgi:hypothetical protein
MIKMNYIVARINKKKANMASLDKELARHRELLRSYKGAQAAFHEQYQYIAAHQYIFLSLFPSLYLLWRIFCCFSTRLLT